MAVRTKGMATAVVAIVVVAIVAAMEAAKVEMGVAEKVEVVMVRERH